MKYLDLKKKIRSPLFTLQDLRLQGLNVFGYQLSLWQKQGHIIKLKNGLYIFEAEAPNVTPEEIAPLLYSPSYLSLEKALSQYAFIPEMTYAITSATPKTTRNFKNMFGYFIYRHLKPSLFFGYKEIKLNKCSYLIADPEKALLDFVYFNSKRLKSTEDIKALRLNISNIKKTISRHKLNEYLKKYNNRIKKAMALIIR